MTVTNQARIKAAAVRKGGSGVFSWRAGRDCDGCDDQMPRRLHLSTGGIAYHV